MGNKCCDNCKREMIKHTCGEINIYICSKCKCVKILSNNGPLKHGAFGKALYGDDNHYFLQDGKPNFSEYNKDFNWLVSAIKEKIIECKSEGIDISIDSNFIKKVFSDVPRTPEEKVNRLLSYVNEHSTYFGEEVCVPIFTIYSSTNKETIKIIEELRKDGLIDCVDINKEGISFPVSITLKGIKYLKERKKLDKREKCFVAMWFDEEMNQIWEEVIEPACKEAGYNPIRIDKKDHNKDITDEIICEIKGSSFVIADLTGFRGGVYYEAGFARGLGKEVIQCCQKDFKVTIKYDGKENDQVDKGPHFDVNHINTIFWEKNKLSEYKESLENRILNTVGRGNYNP